MWRRLDPDPAVTSILDGYGWIICAEGLTAEAELGQVSIVGTYDFDTLAAAPRATFNLPKGHRIVDMQYEAVVPSPIVLSRNGPAHALSRVDRVSGRSDIIAMFSQPVSHLVIGRRNDAYLWHQLSPTAGRLIRIDLDNAGVLDTLSLPGEPRAVCYDDNADQLVLVSPDGSAIGRCDPFLDGYIDEDFPPSLAPVPAGASICPFPGFRGVAVASGDVNAIHIFRSAGHGTLELADTIEHESVRQPGNLHVTPAGTVVFTCLGDGSVRSLRGGANGGVWRTTNFPMNGEHVGDIFRLVQSRTNAGDWFGTRSDVNIDPTDQGEVALDCPADFNADQRVTSQDFFDFLTAFFQNLPAADLNADASVNSQDFFDFLTHFFAGC
jgi:hypothetical protein